MNYQNVAYQTPTYGQPGRIRNWSLNIQHEIKNWLIDVAYQGNRGTRLNSTSQLNQLPTSYLQYGSLLGQRIDSAAAANAGFKKPYDSFPGNLTVAQSLRPYPQYLNVQGLIAGFGRNWYDAPPDQGRAPLRLAPDPGQLHLVQEPRLRPLPQYLRAKRFARRHPAGLLQRLRVQELHEL